MCSDIYSYFQFCLLAMGLAAFGLSVCWALSFILSHVFAVSRWLWLYLWLVALLALVWLVAVLVLVLSVYCAMGPLCPIF